MAKNRTKKSGFLDKEEVREYFDKYKETGDKEVREILIENFLFIPEILARKYTNRGIEYDDIFQVACIGLIYAIDRFDPDRGFEFSSFATPTIIGEIKKYFRDKGWTIKVPRRIQETSKRINNAKLELYQTLGRSPTAEDIADFLGLSEEEVLEVMEASKVYSPQSLDVTFDSGEENEVYLRDLIGEKDDFFDRIDYSDFLMKALEKLSYVERKILLDRYFDKETQVNIAKELGISQMTVSRIEKKVLEKLKKDLLKSIS
ncbi:MAG: SigB/SigF/SigG family RNA polymerase sigma factor [Tissierellia bacterium]|nr:SigB/SigF/SigG family RNA polymerase sigma factor [Tissierellia bacterium]